VIKVNRAQLGLGGCLAGLVILVVASIRSMTAEPQMIRLTRWAACASCGYYGKLEMVDRPGRCPSCGLKKLWLASRCSGCGTVVAIDTFRFDREGREPYCPKCGSTALERMDANTPAAASGRQ
jgi:DNA-directed RNA polymerase subunit RPC12/RpoP